MKLLFREHGRRWFGVILLGIAHGFGDFNAGVLLATLGIRSGADLVLLYLLYNGLAFAGQPLAGFICDRIGRSLSWFQFGGLLSVLSLLISWNWPEMAVICSGLASAFYHSSGGAAAWNLGGKRALAAGIFAAPGVVGLSLGLATGGLMMPMDRLAIGGGLLIVLIALFSITRGLRDGDEAPLRLQSLRFGLVGGVLGWLVILAIAARSFAWSLGQEVIFPPGDAVRLAVAAALGKCFAGFLADRYGAGFVSIVSLVIAAVLLMLAGSTPVLFFPAVTALQAGTGPMMAMVFRAWPRFPAFGSGLAQGLAVALGGAPILVLKRWGSVPVVAAVGSLIIGTALMVVVLRTKPNHDELKNGPA